MLSIILHNKNEGSLIDVHLVVMYKFYVLKLCSEQTHGRTYANKAVNEIL